MGAINSSGTNSGRNLAGVIQGSLSLQGNKVTIGSPLVKRRPRMLSTELELEGLWIVSSCKLTLSSMSIVVVEALVGDEGVELICWKTTGWLLGCCCTTLPLFWVMCSSTTLVSETAKTPPWWLKSTSSATAELTEPRAELTPLLLDLDGVGGGGEPSWTSALEVSLSNFTHPTLSFWGDVVADIVATLTVGLLVGSYGHHTCVQL